MHHEKNFRETVEQNKRGISTGKYKIINLHIFFVLNYQIFRVLSKKWRNDDAFDFVCTMSDTRISSFQSFRIGCPNLFPTYSIQLRSDSRVPSPPSPDFPVPSSQEFALTPRRRTRVKTDDARRCYSTPRVHDRTQVLCMRAPNTRKQNRRVRARGRAFA